MGLSLTNMFFNSAFINFDCSCRKPRVRSEGVAFIDLASLPWPTWERYPLESQRFRNFGEVWRIVRIETAIQRRPLYTGICRQ